MEMISILMRIRIVRIHEICMRTTIMHVMGKIMRVLHIVIMHDTILTHHTRYS